MTSSSRETAWVNGHDVSSDQIHFYAEGTAIDYRTMPSAPWYSLQMRREFFQSLAISLSGQEVEIPLRDCINRTIPREKAAELKTELDAIIVLSQQDFSPNLSVPAQLVEFRILEKLLAALSEASLYKVRKEKRVLRQRYLVDRIETLLDAQQTGPFRISHLMDKTGLQER
ncbi:hypothetical protein [Bythopirellula polymerisocia]|nr:hypothetical protein [Bythopirellula polymerisocia]